MQYILVYFDLINEGTPRFSIVASASGRSPKWSKNFIHIGTALMVSHFTFAVIKWYLYICRLSPPPLLAMPIFTLISYSAFMHKYYNFKWNPRSMKPVIVTYAPVSIVT